MEALRKDQKRKKSDEKNTSWTQVVRNAKPKPTATSVDKTPRTAAATTPTNPGDRPRKKLRKKTNRGKPSAILVKPSTGKSYAEVVGAIRSTRDGNVLLEMSGGSEESRKKLAEALRSKFGDGGVVREFSPRATLEIRDLDCCATKDEVLTALVGALEGSAESFEVQLTRANARGQILTILKMDAVNATKLLKLGRIKVGFLSCKIRARTEVKRCFKCLGYGHESRDCKVPDRSKLCFKCGSGEHKAGGCQNPPLCFLCPDLNVEPAKRTHVAGSGSCQVFRDALERERAKERK